MALRKTETSHHLSLDKATTAPEIFQKSAQLAELPQKPPPGDLPPKPTELAPKPQIGDLPPKPGDLPPKPQLGDLPPKPQLGDLPPKPQLSDLPPKPHMKDLPPKPQLGDVLAKSQPGDVSPKAQLPPDVTKAHPADLALNMPAGDALQKQASEDSNALTPTLPETPVPLPRKINTVGGQHHCSDPCLLGCASPAGRLWGSVGLGAACWLGPQALGSNSQASGPACYARCSCVSSAGSSPSLSLSFLMYKKELTVIELLGDYVQ